MYINRDDRVAQRLQDLDKFEKVFMPLLEAIKQETAKYHFIMIKELESYHNLQESKTKTREEIDRIIKSSEFQKITTLLLLSGIALVALGALFSGNSTSTSS